MGMSKAHQIGRIHLFINTLSEMSFYMIGVQKRLLMMRILGNELQNSILRGLVGWVSTKCVTQRAIFDEVYFVGLRSANPTYNCVENSKISKKRR